MIKKRSNALYFFLYCKIIYISTYINIAKSINIGHKFLGIHTNLLLHIFYNGPDLDNT